MMSRYLLLLIGNNSGTWVVEPTFITYWKRRKIAKQWLISNAAIQRKLSDVQR